jgi:hypothetical protein
MTGNKTINQEELNDKKAKTKVGSPRRQPWNFPKNSLEEAIKLVQQIEEKYAGKKTKATDLVKLVGFHKVNDWRFKELLRSANLYELTKGSGEKATIEPTPLSGDIISPKGPAQRQDALVNAFNNVELFAKVSQHYAGKRIPEDEYFENTLIREYGIPKDRVKIFTKVFTDNLTYLKLFSAERQVSSTLPVAPDVGTAQIPSSKLGKAEMPSDAGQIRQFLDTCFILMPFGEWPDRYFKDIYVPATKEAGFEPVRADVVFSTGSVIKQIWEHIGKAKVLLAELTDKNPNVFYELGLAHARGKPVVLISANIEDVPFDLRHLRTIIYDFREPDWGERLRKNVTEYLKNAKEHPDMTIPEQFKTHLP